jgi:hypothetical protein
LRISQELQDVIGQSNVLEAMGTEYVDAGDTAAAIEAWRQCIELREVRSLLAYCYWCKRANADAAEELFRRPSAFVSVLHAPANSLAAYVYRPRHTYMVGRRMTFATLGRPMTYVTVGRRMPISLPKLPTYRRLPMAPIRALRLKYTFACATVSRQNLSPHTL